MATLGPLSKQLLDGKYRLSALLGQGGFGVVYQAEHVFLKRSQAVKLLLEQHFHRPKFRERFLHEAQTLAALDHPHIVHIDDFGIEGNRAYLVMPYVSGGTLADRLRRGPLDLPTTIAYLEQICEALGFTHAQGIVHLDLKPLNLLIHRDGRLLLSDFGLAHLLSAGAIAGGTSLQFGSPLYMAPEHFDGHPGQESDLYALGIILYQMLTGRVPFEGSSPVAIMRKHLVEPPPPLRAVRPELPPALEGVIGKALAKEPQERYRSAQALLVDFKRVLSGGMEPTARHSPLIATMPEPAASFGPVQPADQPEPSWQFAPTQRTPPRPADASTLRQPPPAPPIFPAMPTKTRVQSSRPAAPTHPPQKEPPQSGRHSSRRTLLVAGGPMLLVVLLGAGWLLNISFFQPGSHAPSASGPALPGMFQGFHDTWLRQWGEHQFMQPDSKRILLSEANDYHMNAVAIDVTADQDTFLSTALSYGAADQGNIDSLPDADIEQAITDAQAAHLTPILTLTVRVTNEAAFTSPARIGYTWYNTPGNVQVQGTSAGIAEHQWFDSYTAFAVHYAQLSQKYHLPYFIFGNDLINMTTDTAATPGASGSSGDTFTCTGRRDCEWRHVINAIKSATYVDYQGKQQTGGGYQDKLIYGASWGGVDNAPPEFEHITWWGAIDVIGVNASFPLTQSTADVPVSTLIDAWHGKQDDLNLAGQGDIIGRLNAVAAKFNRSILFTAVGYESTPGANNNPGAITPTTRDDLEQEHDMEALLRAFTKQTAPWFIGVLWSFDAPKWPRFSLAGWATSTEWAGDTVTGNGPNDAKLGGKFLAQFYQQRPIPGYQ